MKVKIKGVFKDKVEPTTLREVDSADNIEQLKQDCCEFIDRIFNEDDELQGVFISKD